MRVYCINMHCYKSTDAIKGDWYCSEKCHDEDLKREKAGLNNERWQTETYLDENGDLKVK